MSSKNNVLFLSNTFNALLLKRSCIKQLAIMAGFFAYFLEIAKGEEGTNKRGRLLKWGLGIGLPLNALIFIPGGVFDLPVRYLFAPILALGYIGVISRLVEYSHDILIWRWLEKSGQMSLSCYVTQNILASVIFYGWGLGLGGKLGFVGIIIVWIILSFIQLLFAVVWMNVFKIGPLEAARQRMLRVFI